MSWDFDEELGGTFAQVRKDEPAEPDEAENSAPAKPDTPANEPAE